MGGLGLTLAVLIGLAIDGFGQKAQFVMAHEDLERMVDEDRRAMGGHVKVAVHAQENEMQVNCKKKQCSATLSM